MGSAALLGVLTAALFAAGVTVSRLGMRTVDTVQGVYWSVLSTTLVLGMLVLVRGGVRPSPTVFLLVAMAGLLASVVGRFSSFQGALRLGPSRSVAVQSSTYPAVAVIGGLAIFGERLTPARAVGVTLLLLSLRLVMSELPARAVARGASDAGASARPRRTLQGMLTSGPGGSVARLAILFPMASGMAYGGSDLLRKLAVESGGEPLSAATAGILVALVVWSGIVARRSGVRALVRLERGAGWYLLSGTFSAFAVWCSFVALSRGDASVVGPLIATQPVFVAAVSAMILGDLEKRTVRTFLAVLLVTVGAVVLGRFG